MAFVGRILEIYHRLFPPAPHSQMAPPLGLSSEDLRQFLPTFLSQGSETAFLDEIKHFVRSQGKPFYSPALANQTILFQGDGLDGLLVIRLPDPTIRPGRVLLLSNTCDMDPSNTRLFAVSLTYAPILSLPRYLSALRKRFPEARVAAHESDIRQQLITQIFFLPKQGKLQEDSVVFLDRIVSAPSSTVERANVPANRLFTLSDFGAWLLALKLSIHFCRIRDQVDRNAGVIR